MTKRLANIVGSLIYSVTQIAQGLLLHPYQTMQSLVRDKVFFWLTFLPAGIWIIARLSWGWVIVPVVRLVFSCAQSGFWGCGLIPFFTHWLWYFCWLWQLVLIYLFVRFSYAFSRKS